MLKPGEQVSRTSDFAEVWALCSCRAAASAGCDCASNCTAADICSSAASCSTAKGDANVCSSATAAWRGRGLSRSILDDRDAFLADTAGGILGVHSTIAAIPATAAATASIVTARAIATAAGRSAACPAIAAAAASCAAVIANGSAGCRRSGLRIRGEAVGCVCIKFITGAWQLLRNLPR